jgi:hypothetical protein
MLEPAAVAGAAWIVQGEAALIDPAVEAGPVIWTARLRTGPVVMFRASGSRAFKAVALIVLVAAAGSVVIASAVEDLVAAAIDLAAAAALAGSAAVVAGSGADAEINVLNQAPIFL